MPWLFEQFAELVGWTLEDNNLALEIVLCGEGELPAAGDSAMYVRAHGLEPIDGLEAHLEQFGGLLHGVGVDKRADGRSIVTIEGEWEPLVVVCGDVEASSRPPER